MADDQSQGDAAGARSTALAERGPALVPRVVSQQSVASFYSATIGPRQGRAESGSPPRVALTAGAPPETWTRIAPGHSWPDKPRWARDGKWILFISKGSTSYLNLWAIPFSIRTEASRLASLFRSRTSIHPVGSSRQYIESYWGHLRSSCGA